MKGYLFMAISMRPFLLSTMIATALCASSALAAPDCKALSAKPLAEQLSGTEPVNLCFMGGASTEKERVLARECIDVHYPDAEVVDDGMTPSSRRFWASKLGNIEIRDNILDRNPRIYPGMSIYVEGVNRFNEPQSFEKVCGFSNGSYKAFRANNSVIRK